MRNDVAQPVRIVVATRRTVVILLVAAVVATLALAPSPASANQLAPNWPSSNLAANARVHVTGTTDADVATLQLRVRGGWDRVRRARVADDGSFRMRVPTWWVGTRTYRVVTRSPWSSSRPWTVDVHPRYNPGGRDRQHRYSLSSPTRWDPCQRIGWRVNVRQAPRGWRRDVRGAIRRMSQATGYRFDYQGRTRRYPQTGTNRWYPADTQLVIAWARPRNSSLLRSRPGSAGVGAALSYGGYWNGDGSSTYRIVRGMVVLNANVKLRGGFGRGYTRGELLLHEIGHAMGLSHVGSRSQIMYRAMTRRAARLGEGDFAGLEKRGRKMGCLSKLQPYPFRTTASRTEPTSGSVLAVSR